MIGTATILSALLAVQQVDLGTGRHLSPLSDFVTMSLSTDRQTYYLGERMRLSLTFTNVSDQAVRGYFGVPPGLGPTRVYYRTGAAEYVELRGFPRPPGRIGLRRRTLEADEELVKDIDVSVATLEPLTLLFDRIGRYEFRVVVEDVPEDANGRLESNVVSVDVVEAPPEERDAQASYAPTLAYLAQVADGPDAYVTPESMAEAAAFVDGHRRSRYAGPVKDGLLKWLQYRMQTRRATDEEALLYERLIRATDTVAPELHAEASPTTLWPPNRKLMQVLTSVSVSDVDDPNPTVRLESITCDDGCVPGSDIAGASLGTDDREFELRAERKGSGSGRTYTITYSATDASGNKAAATALVVVPHDQRSK